MQEVFAAAPFVVLIVLFAVLRFRPAAAFWGLCLGAVLAKLIDAEGVGKSIAPYTGPTTPNEVALIVVIVPMLVGMLFTIRQSESLSLRALPHVAVLVGVGSLLLLTIVPYLEVDLQTQLRSGQVWRFVLNYGVVAVAVAGVLALMQLLGKHHGKLPHHSDKHSR